MSKSSKKKTIIISTKDINKNRDYMPEGDFTYDKSKTELTKINNNKGVFKAKINTLLKNGRKKITTRDQLLIYPLGSLVSYVTTDGLYRSGGFLRAIKKKYFALQGGTPAKPISFCVQFQNIKAMYVGTPVRLLNRTPRVTNYKVKIGKTTVYYAKDNFDKTRFMNTKRYKDMKNWYDIYGQI
jgi:hypothetical protein